MPPVLGIPQRSPVRENQHHDRTSERAALSAIGARATRTIVATLVAAATASLVSACSTGSHFASSGSSAQTAPSCSQLLDAAIAHERYGTGGDIDRILQSLQDYCSVEYDIAVDYLVISAGHAGGSQPCSELLGFGLRPESVSLAEQDGVCSSAAPAAPVAPAWPDGGLGWDEAGAYAGSVQRVCGPLMSVRETEYGTFVNVGRDYPSANRFTFIFWDIYLEPIAAGAIICGRGQISLYEGVVAQIEMWDPGALEIWR